MGYVACLTLHDGSQPHGRATAQDTNGRQQVIKGSLKLLLAGFKSTEDLPENLDKLVEAAE